MARVLTNNSALSVAKEAAVGNATVIGVLPGEGSQAGTAEWFKLEPNSFGTAGATTESEARSPISANRQRRKGTITDLNSAMDFEQDLTLSAIDQFIEGFMFSRFVGSARINPTSADANSFTVPVGPNLVANTYVYFRGSSVVENNGLKLVGAGSTTTDIVIDGGLTAQATLNQNERLEVCGFLSAAGDLDVSVTDGVVTVTSSANRFNDAGLNLTPGQAVFFGSDTVGGSGSFTTPINHGYARIVSVAANGSSVIIDRTAGTWVTESNTTSAVQFYSSSFVRNVDTGDSDFRETSYQFETTFAGLDAVGSDAYEYSKGNYCNTFPIEIPLTSKATCSPTFIGTDTTPATSTRKTGASAALEPTKTEAFNTTQDMARLRISNTDETGLTTDFKSLTVTLNNNVAPEKVLNQLGARFMNYGNFEVSIEAQCLFTEKAVTSAIRNNDTVSMDFGLRNGDGALFIDIPAMTLGGGGRDFPVNQTVLINLTADAFVDPILGTSLGVSVFAFIPDYD